MNKQETSFWMQFVDVTYWMYSNDKTNLNPTQPPNSTDDVLRPGEFPKGWKLWANIQVTPSFLGDEKTIFQGFIAGNEEENTAAMIFHGTVGTLEWIKDLEMKLIDFTSVENGGKVHEGFYTLLESATLMFPESGESKPLKEFNISEHTAGEDVKFVFAGHSLGGPLAALASVIFGGDELYTYASPKIGNQDWANKAESVVPGIIRTYNIPDLAPDVPGGDYVHVGTPNAVNSIFLDSPIKEGVGCWHSHLTYTYLTAKAAGTLDDDHWGLGECQN